MKSMDKAARLAMLPDYEMFCVDLKDGMVRLTSVMYCVVLGSNVWYFVYLTRTTPFVLLNAAFSKIWTVTTSSNFIGLNL